MDIFSHPKKNGKKMDIQEKPEKWKRNGKKMDISRKYPFFSIFSIFGRKSQKWKKIDIFEKYPFFSIFSIFGISQKYPFFPFFLGWEKISISFHFFPVWDFSKFLAFLHIVWQQSCIQANKWESIW